VKDGLAPADRPAHALVGAQVALDDVDLVGHVPQVRAVAGREVVQSAHRVARVEQAVDEV
jgi:hypothetical protein